MKSFKQHIFEKLKVSANSKIDTRDDDTVGKLYGNDEDKERFQKYLHDCIKRDKYDIQTYNINFIHDRVMFYFSRDQISIILCPFSNDDTYIGLYNRIIDNLKKKQYITEKLKVNSNKNSDPRDYENVDMLSTNASDKRKFLEYLNDCMKRDKYGIQSYNFEFQNNKVMYYYDKYMRSLCDYSVNDTYIELYDRIIDELRKDNFIHEKLKVSKNNYKEYEFKTDKINTNNTHNFHSYFLGNKTMDLFEDYWYCMLENEDQAFVENNNIHYDDIYLDYLVSTVHVYDNNTRDEILKSERGSAYSFTGAYDTILEYFEEKNL